MWCFDFLFLVWCSLVSSVVVSGLTQVLQFPILLYFFFVARKKETDVKEGEENIKQEKFLALTAETEKEKGERSLFSSS